VMFVLNFPWNRFNIRNIWDVFVGPYPP